MGFSLGGNKQKTSQQQTQNTNQTQTFNPNQQFLGQVQTGLTGALGLMGGYGRTTGGDVAGYLNPRQDIISQGIQRQAGIAANNVDAQAAAANAFGGTGWGLLRGETQRGYADAEAMAQATGYDTALNAALAENAASQAYDLNALQTYLSGLGLLGNWGTTTSSGTSTGSSTGKSSGFNWGLTGSF